MTSSPFGSRTQATRNRRPWHAISTWLSRAWRGLVQHWAQAQRHRRDVKALSELDDHQLKDIGLTRGEIESVVTGRSPQRLAPPRAPHRSRLAPTHKTAAAQSSRCSS
jgi:uncharacterized protein YjiS (DUF1127 family)